MKSKAWIRICTVSALLTLLLALTAGCARREPEITESSGETGESSVPMEETTAHTEEVTVPREESTALFLEGVRLETIRRGGSLYVEAAAAAEAMGLREQKGYSGISWTNEERTITWQRDTELLRVNGSPAEAAPALLEEDGVVYFPVALLTHGLGFGSLMDPDTGDLYVTEAAGRRTLQAGVSVPVLMYHALGDDLWGEEELFVSAESLEAQLKYLADNGYETIFFSDLDHLDRYEKPVILTFDDGYDDNYTILYPLLQKYGMKATIFVITSSVGGRHKMTEEQIREMSDSGLVDIQSHTVTHPHLSGLGEEDQRKELEQSRLEITRMTGRVCYAVAYPTGSFNGTTVELTRELYRFGVKMSGGMYTTQEDGVLVERYYIARHTTLESFAKKISGAGTRS